MAKRVQLVRHDSAGSAAFIGYIGEITVNTTNNSLIIHNGVTAGGFELARADLSNVIAATVSNAGKMTAAQVSELTTATANIVTNTANIATNTGDIATINGLLPTGAIVGTTDAQTLTNKTLAAPVFSGIATNFQSTGIDDNSTGTTITLDADYNTYFGPMARATGAEGTFHLSDATVFPAANPVAGIVLYAAAGVFRVRGTAGTLTFPSASDTIVGRATVDTLTNKTLTSPVIITPTLDLSTITSIGDLPITQGGTGSSTASAARTALGVAIGVDVQAYDAGLLDIAGLTPTNSNFIVGDGANWVAESGATVRTSLGLGALAVLSTIDNSFWSGTDLSIANGGTGSSTAAAARLALAAASYDHDHNYDRITTAWVANTAYVVGDKRQSTTPDDELYFECTTAGTSHATTEPTWPTAHGDTVADNSVVWTAVDGTGGLLLISQNEIEDEAVGQAQIKSIGGTVSLAGSITSESGAGIPLTAYSFFPMIHHSGHNEGSGQSTVFMSGYATDGANPDSPRFRFSNQSLSAATYDVDYRFIPI